MTESEFEKNRQKELQLRQIVALEKIAESLTNLSTILDGIITNDRDGNFALNVWDSYNQWKNMR